MPCRRTIPVYESDLDGNTLLNRLGLQFDNIVYPSSDVVGHVFSIARRGNSDTTVVDTGVIVPPSFVRTTDGFTTTPNEVYFKNLFLANTLSGQPDSDTVHFISPNYLTKYTSLRGDHFKFLRRLRQSFYQRDDDTYDLVGANTEARTVATVRQYASTITEIPSFTYKNILDSIFISPNTFQSSFGVFDKEIRNYSLSNTINVHKLEDTIPANETTPAGEIRTILYQAALKRNVKPFENIFNLSYIPLHSAYKTLSDSQVVYGDVYVTELRYVDIFSLYDRAEGSVLKTYAGGDFLNKVWVDSRVNYELIHPGDATCNNIYKDGDNRGGYIINKIALREDPADAWTLRDEPCKEYYGYNKDYSKI